MFNAHCEVPGFVAIVYNRRQYNKEHLCERMGEGRNEGQVSIFC